MPVNSSSFDQLLEILRCPKCGQVLEFQSVAAPWPQAREFGILKCRCASYPVVDGIPILMGGTVGAFEHTMGSADFVGPAVEDLCQKVLAGRGVDALLRCIAFPITLKRLRKVPPRRLWTSRGFLNLMAGLRRGQLRSQCLADRASLSAEDWLRSFFGRFSPVQGDMFNYSFYRLAQPRYLATLALTKHLPESNKPVLDLACGFGHLGYNLSECAERHVVVGVDRNFFQLWLAQHWIAPKNRFVCANADESLPFRHGSFSATLCSDAFHYFRRKDLVMEEIDRCGSGRPVLLTRVGNKAIEPNEGFELTPTEYLRLCKGDSWMIFGEEELLSRYLAREPAIASQHSKTIVPGEKWLSLVYPGTPPDDMRRNPSSGWLHAVGPLAINPIYRVSRAGQNWRLDFRFPSDHYKSENARMGTYCPQTITISDETYRQVKTNIRSPEVEHLIGQMVAIGVPNSYVSRKVW